MFKHSIRKLIFRKMTMLIFQLLFALTLIITFIEANPVDLISDEPDEETFIYINESSLDSDSHYLGDYEADETARYSDRMNIPLFPMDDIRGIADEDERRRMEMCMELHMIIQSYNENYGIFDETDIEMAKKMNSILCN